MAERRRFSKRERQAVELVSGSTGDQADHIKPLSAGGVTSVENCQLIGSVNQVKGSADFVPREWQVEFLEKWSQRKPHTPFMLIAIPGSGKTKVTLEACRKWMAAGPDRRMLVIVPTDNLRTQWQEEAALFGIQLQTKEFGTNFKDGYKGAVATYHLVANSPLEFRKLCSVAPTMVVFDEIHHCSTEAHFGRGITTAFELAKERLLLSGTPWKTDGTMIPYVKYDGSGYAVADYSYDLPRALNDNVVRYLVFDHHKGNIVNDVTGEVEEVSRNISEDDAKRRLRRILDPSGSYVREMITAAHRKLLECRRTVPDAAAMAACVDQFHATKVADLIREVTGCSPSVIVSDADLENDSVKEFRKSSREWIVSVRKVSEGTDIKRLQVLCYLTNITSELFFRQLVGRVARVREMEDYEAYVYLPADPRLIHCSTNITNAQVQALRELSDRESRELDERQKGVDLFDSFSTQHDGSELVLIGNEMVPTEQARLIERIAESEDISMQKVMRILSLGGSFNVAPQAKPESVPLEQAMDELRRKCNRAAFRLSKLADCDVREIHGRFKPQGSMTETQLKSKLHQLVRECKEFSR